MTKDKNSKNKEHKLDLIQMPIDKGFIDGIMWLIQSYGDIDKKPKNKYNFKF